MNTIAYLGKDEARPPTQRLSENVVVKIMESYSGKEETSQLTIFLHLATQLWRPVTVFYNILGLASINAYVCIRRNFMFHLATELREAHVYEKAAPLAAV